MYQQIMLFAVVAFLFVTTSFAKAQENANDGKLPTGSQLIAIAGWLSTHFDLPFSTEPPRVELVPSSRLLQLRYRGFVMDKPQVSPPHVIGGEFSTPIPTPQREVVAIYDDSSRTIYLPDTWKGDTPAEQSILVHEMVHHLQNRGSVKYDCPGAREKPAYLAQRSWLANYGLNLEDEFQVDMFTIVTMSACME